MTPLVTPCVHLNGTGREALTHNARTAAQAVLDACDALSAASPNARDYYPLGDDAYPRSARAWGERMEALRALAQELMDYADTIEDAGR